MGLLPETTKADEARRLSGFYSAYMTGRGVDVGYKGNGISNPAPVLPNAIGIDLGYPGYDGINLPFTDLDFVFSSHTLEHVSAWKETIQAWYKAIKVGGHIITIVPHQFLYEKKLNLPSRWNGDHKRFYTPAKLLAEFEAALAPNSYRVEHLADNAAGFDYSIGPDKHSSGAYEIELVIKKIQPPLWTLA